MISENAVYWIWLTQTIGYNNPKIKKISEFYPDVSEFYLGGEKEWRYCGIFSENELKKLNSQKYDCSYTIIERCKQLEYSVICIDDENYPKCLYNIYSPPAVIYVKGCMPDVDNRLTIGIVGTRRATKYGIDNSYKFAYALAKYSVATISGGALGVDCASHRGALAAGGTTVCVRGCGINCSYLQDNYKMREAITKDGAVISEYPPDETPRNYYFPARNRIISALSDGVLIIEAGIKSGSLITANLAIEQGKEVFALIGNNSPQNEGSNNRIKEGSAIPVTDFMDILNSFDNLCVSDDSVNFDSISLKDIAAVPVKGKIVNTGINLHNEQKNKNIKISKEPVQKAEHKLNLNLSKTAQKIYDYINEEPVHIDKISSDLDIPVYKVLTSVTLLEMQGLVEALQGRRYKLKKSED